MIVVCQRCGGWPKFINNLDFVNVYPCVNCLGYEKLKEQERHITPTFNERLLKAIINMKDRKIEYLKKGEK